MAHDALLVGVFRGGRVSVVLVSAALVLLTVGTLAANSQSVARQETWNWTLSDWTKWRDSQIAAIFEQATVQGGQVLSREAVAQRSAEALRTVDAALLRDPHLFENDPALGRKLGNFLAFVRAQSLMARKNPGGPSHQLGLEIDDVQYWAMAFRHVSLPGLLASQEFLEKLAKPASYLEAVEMIEEQNSGLPEDKRWIVLPFRAQFVHSVDHTTYGRLLVLVPDDPGPDGALYDRWVTFAIATPEQAPAPDVRSVSVVSVRKPAQPGGSNRAYFMDYLRTPVRGSIALMPNAILPENPSKNCYDCHKAAVIPVRPEAEYEFDASGSLVEKTLGTGQIPRLVNSRIRGYGKTEYEHFDDAAYGPSVGPASRDGREGLVRAMARSEGLGEASVARIAAQMRCAGCHDAFAPLNYPEPLRTDRDVGSMKYGRGLAQTFVEEGWMPPGNDLTPAERKALWKCLSKEYFDAETGGGLLVDWLKGR